MSKIKKEYAEYARYFEYTKYIKKCISEYKIMLLSVMIYIIILIITFSITYNKLFKNLAVASEHVQAVLPKISTEISLSSSNSSNLNDYEISTQTAESLNTFEVQTAIPQRISAARAAAVSAIIEKFADNIYSSKISTAAKLCINAQSGFLSREFIDEFKSNKGKPLKIKEMNGNQDDTISVVLEFEGETPEDIMTQEFVMLYNPHSESYVIANIFDRFYENMNTDKEKCLTNSYFLENALIYYQRMKPDFSFTEDMRGDSAFKKLITGGFLKSLPLCPAGGTYICLVEYNPEINSYEIMAGCSKHGYLSEISKLCTNLDRSEKLYARFDAAALKLADSYCEERFLKIFKAADREKEIYEAIRMEDINGAISKFRALQNEEKLLGELYPALSDALINIGRRTEAVSLLKEASEYYPEWNCIIDRLKNEDKNE